MPRTSRTVTPGSPHHVIQRGSDNQDALSRAGERHAYLRLLRENCARYGLKVLAWCLMPNQVQYIVIPAQEDSLSSAMRQTNLEYARQFPHRGRRGGNLWQSRFFSCPLERDHLWETIRYVELSPMRAGLVRTLRDWRWSSAAAHLHGMDEWGLTDLDWWREHARALSWATVLEADFVTGVVPQLRAAPAAMRASAP